MILRVILLLSLYSVGFCDTYVIPTRVDRQEVIFTKSIPITGFNTSVAWLLGGKNTESNFVDYSIEKDDCEILRSNCTVWDGSAFLSVAGLTTNVSVTSSGGTSAPTITTNRINFTSGTCWDLKLSNGSHYPMAEGAISRRCYDTSTNAIHGYVSNGVLATVFSGKQDVYHRNLTLGGSKVLTFDGSAYVNIGMRDFSSPSGSIYAVINSYQRTNSAYIVGRNLGGNFIGDINLYVDTSNGKFNFTLQDGTNTSTVYSDGVVTNLQWYSVLATWSSTGTFMYVDGVKQTSNAAGIFLYPHVSQSLAIGAPSTSNSLTRFIGDMADIRIFNSELTATDRALLFSGSETVIQPIKKWQAKNSYASTLVESIGTSNSTIANARWSFIPVTDNETNDVARLRITNPKNLVANGAESALRISATTNYFEDIVYGGMHPTKTPDLLCKDVYSSKELFTFVVGGDLQWGYSGASDLSNAVNSIKAFAPESSFLVINGDLANQETNAVSYPALKTQLTNSLSIPYFLTTGNHDVSGTSVLWTASFPALPYSFETNGYTFIMLDGDYDVHTNMAVFTESQEAWLTNTLNSVTNKAFVFEHISMYPITDYSANDEGFQNICSNYASRIAAVFFSHNHYTSMAYSTNGNTLLFTGRMGSDIGKEKGYRIVKVYDDGRVYSAYVTNEGIKQDFKTID